MTGLKLAGSTSGVLEIAAPAVAGSHVLTAPAETGQLRSTASSGTIIQIKHTQFGTTTGALTGNIPVDNTVPQNTEGNEITSLDTSITPTSTANWLVIEVVLQYYITTGSTCVVGLFQDSTANALATAWGTIGTGMVMPVVLRHKMVAGTTSATTFKIRAGGDSSVGAHTYINGGAAGAYMGGTLVSSITITEVVP